MLAFFEIDLLQLPINPALLTLTVLKAVTEPSPVR